MVVAITTDRACNEKWKHLHQVFLQAEQGEAINEAASDLLSRVDEKGKGCWSKVVSSIDFTNSSSLAWNTINNLTGRTRHQHRSCPISADLIASQLVQNGFYKTKGFKHFFHCILSNTMEDMFKLCMILAPPDKF